MKTAIINLETIVSGDWRAPFAEGDAILCEDGRISAIGAAGDLDIDAADVVIDAGGATAAPRFHRQPCAHHLRRLHAPAEDGGLSRKLPAWRDDHGDSAPRRSTRPAAPRTPQASRRWPLPAQRCFRDYRPGGMRVFAGSVILEPGLRESDFAEMAAEGVWLAKAGFGAFADPMDYAPYIAMAKAEGFVTTMHTGGASIPGSSPIWGAHVIGVAPDVSFHVNGGPVAMPDGDFERVIRESGGPRCRSARRATCARHFCASTARLRSMPSTA